MIPTLSGIVRDCRRYRWAAAGVAYSRGGDCALYCRGGVHACRPAHSLELRNWIPFGTTEGNQVTFRRDRLWQKNGRVVFALPRERLTKLPAPSATAQIAESRNHTGTPIVHCVLSLHRGGEKTGAHAPPGRVYIKPHPQQTALTVTAECLLPSDLTLCAPHSR